MDISAASSLVAKTQAAAQPHGAPVQTVQQVERKAATSDAGSEAQDHSKQESQAQAMRDIFAMRKAAAKGERPTGPPPSFEVSLLEVEADLQQTLARMESERAKARDAEAVDVPAQTEDMGDTDPAIAAPQRDASSDAPKDPAQPADTPSSTAPAAALPEAPTSQAE